MRWTWLVVCWIGLVSPIFADEPVDYVRRIKPVLQARCYACHGVLKQEAGLRLDTAALALKGGDAGAVIKPGDIDASSILRRVSSADEAERMPPEGEQLKEEEIAALRGWILAGASAPADEVPERDPRDHWAFKPVVRPRVPDDDWGSVHGEAVGGSKTPLDRGRSSSGTCKNPIDSFIAATHQKIGLRPQLAVDKRTWLRRVTLDLIGLPPTREELDSFLADDSSEAIETVVTRLLDSPQYGERWGRHWMDIWRYSDWWGLGEDARNSQKHIWHWRDWIIESLNSDKGYDQMLREMLAADELYPEDFDKLRAGGFLGRQYFKFNRTSWLDETIEHTAKAMLGLTFNCAKCHDHKYDPFSQADYYRFRAVFEPYQIRLDSIGGQIDFEKDGIPRPFDCNLDAKTYIHIRGDDRNPDTNRIMQPAFPAFLSHVPMTIEPVSLPPVAIHPGLRPEVIDAYLRQAEQKIAEKRGELETAKKRLAEAERLELLAASMLPEDAQRNSGETLVKDEFTVAKPDLWEMLDGEWIYADGKLSQSKDGSVRGVLKLKQLPPPDFEVKFKFIPTGGQVWKSVGITFDGTDSNELLAYLSAYAQGSKAQFAYKKGDYVYPGEATQARPILLGMPYELMLRVRGTLINILVNGEHSIAYRLPLARQRGQLQLITFDARAEFHSFELKSLPATTMLVEATTGNRPVDSLLPVAQSKLAIVIAEKSLEWAMKQPDAIRARAAADQARFQLPPSERAMELARAAARSERILSAAKAEEEVARAELDVVRAAMDKKAELEAKLATARTALENARKAIDEPSESFTSLRGASKALESNLETEESRLKPFPATSTGRRSALAKWIIDPRNPLTARVAVNHIWSRHFGRPLVPTVFDFGRKGTPPTHPELLDWLAMELIEGCRSKVISKDSETAAGSHRYVEAASSRRNTGWSMKHIHRLIVTSNAYHMTSSTVGAASENLAKDQDNRFLWRMNPIRMESQIVRDSLLSLAGELDSTMGGPSIPISNETSRRRSIYFVHSNIEHQKFLSMFDDASVLDCYRRAESIVPQQALALENSPLAIELSRKITEKILVANRAASNAEFIRDAFLTVLCIEPTESEEQVVAEAMSSLIAASKHGNDNERVLHARIKVVQALINHNDFVTVR